MVNRIEVFRKVNLDSRRVARTYMLPDFSHGIVRSGLCDLVLTRLSPQALYRLGVPSLAYLSSGFLPTPSRDDAVALDQRFPPVV